MVALVLAKMGRPGSPDSVLLVEVRAVVEAVVVVLVVTMRAVHQIPRAALQL
jgi:hypothetical protein